MGKRGGGRSRMTFIKHASEIINADIFGAKKEQQEIYTSGKRSQDASPMKYLMVIGATTMLTSIINVIRCTSSVCAL